MKVYGTAVIPNNINYFLGKVSVFMYEDHFSVDAVGVFCDDQRVE